MSSRLPLRLLPIGLVVLAPLACAQAPITDKLLIVTLGCDARGLPYGMMGSSTDDAVMGPYERLPADMRRDHSIAGTAAQ